MRLLLSILLWLAAASSHAHKASDAYWTVEVHGDRIAQRLDISLRDLERELALDANDDGRLSWGEVRSRWAEIDALATAAVRVQAEGRTCTEVQRGAPQLDEHSDGRYAVLTSTLTCDGPVAAVVLHYGLFAASDPTHRGVARLVRDGAAQAAVLDPAAAPRRFVVAEHDAPRSFLGFVAEGVHHILIGTDHVLFLLALLLPAVLVRREATRFHRTRPGDLPASGSESMHVAVHPLTAQVRAALAALPGPFALSPSKGRAEPVEAPTAWHPAPALRPVLIDVLRVVTAFTLAHSITLALAVFDVIDPPSRWVESIIAASVALAALNNLRPMVAERRWTVTFAFGLVHGFGFAGALKDLGLTSGSLVAPLLGFNLGVELGQIGIVAVFLPLAWALRRHTVYRRVALQGGSWLIAIVAGVWLIERAFDLALFT